MVRFNCRVGHSYYAEALLSEQAEVLDAALWTAVRTFKEHVLARQVAGQQRHQGNGEAAARFDEQAQVAERYGTLIQHYLLRGGENPLPNVPPNET